VLSKVSFGEKSHLAQLPLLVHHASPVRHFVVGQLKVANMVYCHLPDFVVH
jgi:hypothetical protein